MNKKERRDNGWRVAGIFFAVFSLVPLFLGFHKMFVYENGEYLWSEPVNAYVGGDAYNYIINANYAIGYFVLAGVLILSAIGCGVLWYLEIIMNKIINKCEYDTIVEPTTPKPVDTTYST